MRNGYPLVELHRHLDGNVRLETVVDLARRHQVELPATDAEGLRPHVQVMEREPDLMAFIAKFECLRRVFVDYDAVRRIARENVEDAQREGIDYIELRFSPYFMAERHGLDPARVVEAVCDGVDEALQAEAAEAATRDPALPPRARLIGIISRHFGPEVGWIELEAALAFRGRGVVALDLAGDEAGFPGELFVEHFRRAREEGLHVIAHAGEAAGAASVRQAIEGLGAERIGHGVRSVEDPALVDLIVERGIPLEVCPTSNLQTSTVDSWQEHPLPGLLARGVKVNLNTDDPSISGIDLAHEYRVAEEKLGMGEAELRRLQENAVEAAFLSDEERAALVAAAET
jgi:adenosine deaminase